MSGELSLQGQVLFVCQHSSSKIDHHTHLDACLDVLAVDPAEDRDLREAKWSPCLIRAPLGEMEKALSLNEKKS